MYRFIAVAIVMIFVGLNVYLFSDQTDFQSIKLKTNRGDFVLNVELADNFRARQKGLMYREKLPVGSGMLFIFNKPIITSFWMKNTLIPLDMIFIDEDMIIKRIEQKALPCNPDETCKIYSSQFPVKYVLEVPGGYTKLFGVREGDVMEFNSLGQ